ncbi:MAG: bifunctional diaminohydroxyphosphoribosylaminopyrimidine deaminase/5-amino-6-(5-phosphoribosylamino)uracil reductase RibD [Acidimicrobiia bacterium]
MDPEHATVEAFMKEAVRLATRGRWTAHPNPAVGAVVVKDGQIVGRGYHRGPGTPHAEAEALKEAGTEAYGADLYVTLEPCVHTGRTPPCTEAILASRVHRVFIGMIDPDKRVSGRGVELLRQKGLKVEVGFAQKEVEAIDPEYFHHKKTGRPFVRYKTAATLDGFVAAADGSSKWITSGKAREDAHFYRARADAIAVGSGTVVADDPELTCRLDGFEGPQPVRVIFDTSGRLSGNEKLFSTAASFEGGAIAIFSGPAGAKSLSAKLRSAGHEVEVVSAGDLGCWHISNLPRVGVVTTKLSGGVVDVGSTLRFLGSVQIVELLLEGGPRLAASFVAGGYIDEMVLYIGAKLLGGGGIPILEGEVGQSIDSAEMWQVCEVSRIESDAKIVARPIGDDSGQHDRA